MSGKTDDLVRELARLFLRYDLADWAPILDELRSGSPEHNRIAAAIETAAATNQAARAQTRARGVKRRAGLAVEVLERAPEQRRGALSDLAAALAGGRVLPRLSDLRAAYLGAGGKGVLPKRREGAVSALLLLLAEVQEERFADALGAIWQESQLPETDLKQDYARWSDLISGLGSQRRRT